MIRDENRWNIYDLNQINQTRKINKNKVIVLVLCVLILIFLALITGTSIKTIGQYNVYKQYESQMLSMQQQDAEKQAKIVQEQEKKRQEKLPKLTQERKR